VTVKAQITLTSAEAKRLIAKAVVKLEVLKKALNNGTVVIHPSTTTSFILKEIFGKFPSGGFACGVVTPKGTCISKVMLKGIIEKGIISKPDEFLPWVIKDGRLLENIKLIDALKGMSSNDVYIKTGNALDPEGNVGVFVGNSLGGTIGIAFSICTARGINLVIPINLEKLISTPIREASRETGIQRMNYSMGMPVGLLPINGVVVTELEAVKILSGASAVQIGAGGIMGAEGATTMVVKGEETQVKEAIRIVESIKGSRIPPISLPDCVDCAWPTCPLRGKT
jgi:hypothetical protein